MFIGLCHMLSQVLQLGNLVDFSFVFELRLLFHQKNLMDRLMRK